MRNLRSAFHRNAPLCQHACSAARSNIVDSRTILFSIDGVVGGARNSVDRHGDDLSSIVILYPPRFLAVPATL